VNEVNTFAPVYRATVLEPDFRLSRARLLPWIARAWAAHGAMLAARGLVGPEVRETARRLLGLQPEASLPEGCEDLFFALERQLGRAAGPERVAAMRLALSRNDLDATAYRLAVRSDVLVVAERLGALRGVILELAGRHRGDVMVAYTHGQQAQPTTVGNYLLAVASLLGRDDARLQGVWQRSDACPMGAAALAGTGFAIDRAMVSRLLGFSRPTDNTYDAVCASDHFLEWASALAVLAGGLSRFVHDLIFWTANEVGALHLAPGFVQISSIMPQKRNPVALEHVRAMCSRMAGSAAATFALTHNVPLGDVNDVGGQTQIPLAEAAATAAEALSLLAGALADARFDTARMEALARGSLAAATELADELVRRGWTFGDAHRAVSAFVEDPAAGLDAAAIRALGRPAGLSSAEVASALDPVGFVRKREVQGGPGPEATAAQLDAAWRRLRADRRRWAAAGRRLAAADAELQASVEGPRG
jgi:argininosuccinate lyase